MQWNPVFMYEIRLYNSQRKNLSQSISRSLWPYFGIYGLDILKSYLDHTSVVPVCFFFYTFAKKKIFYSVHIYYSSWKNLRQFSWFVSCSCIIRVMLFCKCMNMQLFSYCVLFFRKIFSFAFLRKVWYAFDWAEIKCEYLSKNSYWN